MEKRALRFISVFLVTSFTIILSILLFSSIILSVIQTASADDAQQIQKTYNWLQSKTVNKWTSLNVPQHVFSVLALNEKAMLTTNQLNKSIKDLVAKSKDSGTCWPSPTCDAINTSLAKLAIDNAGLSSFNSDLATEWLANHTKPARIEGMQWFLQIVQPPQTETFCSIIYGEPETNYELVIDNTSEIQSSDLGECLSVYNKYWLGITKEDVGCLNETYSIVCSSGIKANFLFKITQDGMEEWYIIGKTYDADATELISVNLTSNCIVPNLATNDCDYESTLWAAFAYYSDGQTETAKTFLPYLIMQKNEDNKKYLPSSFLYYMTSKENYADEITLLQIPNGLIGSSTAHNSYYNTAIARRTGSAKNTNITKMNDKLIKDLRKEGANYYWQDSESSGNSIKDTAILLWAVGREFSGSQVSDCEKQGFTCVDNCTGLGGTLFPEFSCLNSRECCDLSSTSYDCEQRNGNCRQTCYSNETQLTYNCEAGTICCKSNSLLSCISELRGQVCTGDQDCVNSQNNSIMPFVDASESRCCLYNCTSRGGGQQQSCTSLGGEVCDPALGKACQQGGQLFAIEPNCCRLGFCSTGSLTCSQQGGTRCASGEGCKDGTLVIAADTSNQQTCCIQGGRCIQQSCTGASCEDSEACYGGTMKETVDVLRCCEEGNCLKTCSGYGGNPCGSDLVCKGTKKPASDFANCCVGTCEKKAPFPWLIVIIIVVVALGVLAFFLLRKKGGKTSEDKNSELMYGFPPSSSPSPSAIPSSYPHPSSKTRPVQAPVVPIAPRAPQTQSQIQPQQQRIVTKTQTTQSISKSTAKKRPTKAKTSRENDLDDTLEKLKKMSGD